MREPDFTNTRWRKSSVSGDSGCVEVAHADGMVGVRDSQASGNGPVLTVSKLDWREFLAGVRLGMFDLDRFPG